MVVTIPEPSLDLYVNGIRHPDLYLWDAWSFIEPNGNINLYSLAVSRSKADGSHLPPMDRNDFPFHIRHFKSTDDGVTWRDEGSLITHHDDPTMPDAQTIWSGSIEPLSDGKILLAYTGLYDSGPVHRFVQNLMLALTDGNKIIARTSEPLICPRRDWDMITKAGYYLADRDTLGHRDGEGGGPIMAWRDPFIFVDQDNRINLFWSAKTTPSRGAMGHATVRRDGNRFSLDTLSPPVALPDGEEFTQFELPKVYWNKDSGTYILIGSSCNRRQETQPDSEVEKVMRVYWASSLHGPWQPYGAEGSVLKGLNSLFGMTVLKADYRTNQLLCIAPYTDVVGVDKRLTFAPRFHLNLDTMKITFD